MLFVIYMETKKKNIKVTKSIRLDVTQIKIIKRLIPFYGSNEGEVLRNIVLLWLHDNLGSPTIKTLRESKAIDWDKEKEE